VVVFEKIGGKFYLPKMDGVKIMGKPENPIKIG